ncbi:MAG: hypothetical protein P4L90_21165 [Rhodopila sp.]|nr:hypothetical protein [Rhodopila sp.]
MHRALPNIIGGDRSSGIFDRFRRNFIFALSPACFRQEIPSARGSMSYSTFMPARNGHIVQRLLISFDFIFALVFILIFAIVIHAFQYHNALAESDLYRVLVGLMDGAVSGTGLASDLHYDRDFGFGYLAAFYALVDSDTLRDPDRLMDLMNQIGFWSMLPGLLFFWCAVRLVHGSLAATVALIVFALGPMIPELATSGHQTIPMFGFLCAGAALLLLPVTGWKAVLAAAGGGALLLIGMTIRGELFLALPWLVLARVDTRSMRRFVVSGFQRSIAPALALIAFIALQHHVESAVNATVTSTVSIYFRESYSWITIRPGLIYMIVGCGFATVAAAAVAFLYLGWTTLFTREAPINRRLAECLSPLALIVVPLLFFLPNPVPTRHFIMPLAGMSILIGIALARRPAVGRVTALCVAIGIGAANQVLAEVARLPLLRVNEAQSPYLPVPTEYPTATHANLGWEWRRHAALVERRARWQAFGEELLTSCDTHVIVLSDEVEQLFSRLYAGGTPVEARRLRIDVDTGAVPINPALRQDAHAILVGEGATRLTGLIGVRRGKTFIMLEKSHLWPADAVAAIMANPAYAEYKLIADPYTLSKYDKTPIPADRAPRFGCSDSGG